MPEPPPSSDLEPDAERSGEREGGSSDQTPTHADDRVNRVVRTFLEEPTLWPVGLVLLLSGSSFGALILVFAIRARGLAAMAALLVLIFVTVRALDPDLRARRLSPAGGLLLAFWAGSALLGVGLEWLGAFG